MRQEMKNTVWFHLCVETNKCNKTETESIEVEYKQEVSREERQGEKVNKGGRLKVQTSSFEINGS